VANDSWPHALQIDASGAATVKQYIDQPGQSRWYKFTVQPGSRVLATLTSLPANYDLTLYKDISAAFRSVSSPGDLVRLGAEFAPEAFSRCFQPDAFSPDAFSPDAFSPDAFSPDASPDASARMPSHQMLLVRRVSPTPSARSFLPDALLDAFSPDAFSRRLSPDASPRCSPAPRRAA
jgi:hypothetical protein